MLLNAAITEELGLEASLYQIQGLQSFTAQVEREEREGDASTSPLWLEQASDPSGSAVGVVFAALASLVCGIAGFASIFYLCAGRDADKVAPSTDETVWPESSEVSNLRVAAQAAEPVQPPPAQPEPAQPEVMVNIEAVPDADVITEPAAPVHPSEVLAGGASQAVPQASRVTAPETPLESIEASRAPELSVAAVSVLNEEAVPIPGVCPSDARTHVSSASHVVHATTSTTTPTTAKAPKVTIKARVARSPQAVQAVTDANESPGLQPPPTEPPQLPVSACESDRKRIRAATVIVRGGATAPRAGQAVTPKACGRARQQDLSKTEGGKEGGRGERDRERSRELLCP